MDFEKKYPITQIPNEYLVVQWTRGYGQVDVYYNDQLIGAVRETVKLKKGTSFSSDLGLITLKLSEKPVTLDVIVDGFHSPVNVSYPVKELKKMNTYFWIIAVFAFIAGAIEYGIFRGWPKVQAAVLLMNLLVFGLYIFSAVFVGKGKAWAFYLGLSVFLFCTLISLLALMGGIVWGWALYFFMIMRIAGGVILFMNLKTANSTVRHLRYKAPSIDGLLDSKL
ncbi:MAG: hypothetical protein K0S23_389 [Fluviicola sp.]|jgi:hypothetical protein|uniref:hypothetical protein n=1 Tax=Fluviicola sp. TaxID=1917219 RepID=UPI002608EA07|nr:hypothetical protein [Fluviicola sp.]MDF3026082.1 hypothetical protein [Fluviicola sp.]